MTFRNWINTFHTSLPRLLRAQIILPMLIIAVFVTSFFFSLRRIVNVAEPVIEQDLPASVHEGYMSTHFHAFLYWMMASNQPGIANPSRQQRLDFASREFAAFNQSVDEYAKLNVASSARQFFASIVEARGGLMRDIQETGRLSTAVMNGAKTPTELAAFLETRLLTAAKPIENGLKNLASLHEVMQKQTEEQVTHTIWLTIAQTAMLVIFAAMLLVSLGLLLRDKILRLLGDLSDQLRQSFTAISESSADLKNVSSELAVSTAQALASLTENSASLHTIDELLERTAHDTIRSVAGSQVSLSSAHAGEHAVNLIMEAMSEIQHNSQNLEEFAAIIGKMRTQTKAIDEIVFKTQILSFNMAIEVARAGRAGRAFEVITKEMNVLAEMSGQAAAQIDTLLDDSANSVQTIISGVRERLEAGQERATKTSSVFQEILANVADLNTNVKNISDATKAQSESVRQASLGAGELSAMLANNQGVVHRVESASLQLTREAGTFEQALARLTQALGQGSKSA